MWLDADLRAAQEEIRLMGLKFRNGEDVPLNGFVLRDERLAREKMLRISEDINVRYVDAFKALAKSERQDRENEILFGFERNLHESRR